MQVPDMMEAKKRVKDNNTEFIYVNPIMNNKFMGKKYYIRTYGCQMNVHDSEEIAGILENLGFVPCEEMEEADLVLLNTCAIRENAHDKVFGFLGRCKHIKEQINKDLIICLCGCMAQERSVVDEIMSNHKYIDLVFGTHNIHELPEYLMNLNGKLDVEVKSNDENVYEIGEGFVRTSKYSAWVNIMYGCDKFCTYCIVPYTRGKERSRKSSDILKEVCKLKQMGYKEVTLLGQNVNAYGKDR
jgi:tRNA-2-methylthio-N6-dimethylallyladenosine synthase